LTSVLDGGEWSASRPGRITPQGKSSCYTSDRRLGGPQSRSGRGGEEKNSQPTPGIEPYNPDRPSRSPVLYRIRTVTNEASYENSGNFTRFKFSEFIFHQLRSILLEPKYKMLLNVSMSCGNIAVLL
jgi:hypothetical protein